MQKGAALALLLAVGSQQASYAQQGIALKADRIRTRALPPQSGIWASLLVISGF